MFVSSMATVEGELDPDCRVMTSVKYDAAMSPQGFRTWVPFLMRGVQADTR